MNETKKNKRWRIIIAIMMSALFLMIPLVALGSTNQAPEVTFSQNGGEVLKQTSQGITKISVTATDPEKKGIKQIKYDWDCYSNYDTTIVVTYKVMQASCTVEIPVPQTSGLHILRAWARI